MQAQYWLPILLAIVVVAVIGVILMIPHEDPNFTDPIVQNLPDDGQNGLTPPERVGDPSTPGSSGTHPDLAGGGISPDDTLATAVNANGGIDNSTDTSNASIASATGEGASGNRNEPDGPPGTVSGLVQSSQGNPLTGVSIEVTGQPPRSTGPDGRFSFENLSGDTVTLTAQKEGYQTLTKEGIRTGTANLTLTLVNEGALAGRVINQNGDPVSSAKIHIQARQGIWVRDLNTDQNGRFQVDKAPDATVVITASKAGYESEATQEVESPSAQEIILQLEEPMFTISGRAYQLDSQQGVPNFSLIAKREDAAQSEEPMIATTDGVGLYRFDRVRRGTYVVSSHAEHNAQQNLVVPLDQDFKTVRVYDASANNVDFQVAAGRVVQGRVVTDGGQGISGAEVSVAKLGAPKTFSGTDGRFTMNGVPIITGGRQSLDFIIQIFASHPDYGTGLSETIPPDINAPISSVEIVLKGQAQIQGSVVNTQGHAVPEAQVVLYDTMLGNRRETLSAPTGEFSFDQISSAATQSSPLQGTHVLEASKPGFGRVRKEIVVVPGVNQNITLTLGEGGQIQGLVTNSDGQGLAGVSVTTWHNSMGAIRAQSDAAGIYSLDSLPEGSYDIKFELQGEPPLTGFLYNIPVGTNGANVVLTPSEWIITGTVFNFETKQPVNHFLINVRGRPNSPQARPYIQSRVFNTPDGTYQLKVHEPGDYVLGFTADGYQPMDGSVSVSPNWQERQFLNIELLPVQGFGGITGSLNAPPGTTLVAVNVVGHKIFPTEGNSFSIEQIPSGRHDLIFYVKDQQYDVGQPIGGLTVMVDVDQIRNLGPIPYERLQITRN